MITLRYRTARCWTDAVLADFDVFLADHANAEYKASGMAMSMALHYTDKPDIVNAMIELAIEELAHFREVVKLMHERGLHLQKDSKDTYVNAMRREIRRGRDEYFLDRLLIGGIIEARGAERFSQVADALPAGKLRDFYVLISRSEDRHRDLFTDLASNHFDQSVIERRLDRLLNIEAELTASLPIYPRLH